MAEDAQMRLNYMLEIDDSMMLRPRRHDYRTMKMSAIFERAAASATFGLKCPVIIKHKGPKFE